MIEEMSVTTTKREYEKKIPIDYSIINFIYGLIVHIQILFPYYYKNNNIFVLL